MEDSRRIKKRSDPCFLNLVPSLCLALFLLTSCSNNRDSKVDTSSTKFRQYYVQGEKLYLKHCSNCHQKDGTGLGLLYPPLANSDYLTQNFDSVICMIRYGRSGPIIVNGETFDQPMPPLPTLGDLEIAEIATYIYNTWGNERGIIQVTDASAILGRCHGETSP
jgi:cytochrome c551